jgi:hypothetical protein
MYTRSDACQQHINCSPTLDAALICWVQVLARVAKSLDGMGQKSSIRKVSGTIVVMTRGEGPSSYCLL